MLKNTIWIGLALSLLGFIPAATAHADQADNKSVITFSQPVEIPGQVLPAGTYTFKLLDVAVDRHVVQIFNADGSQIIATVMAIPDYRLHTTNETVIRFHEVAAGSPEAIRAWFYPGDSVGQEFVYPKARAVELARASKFVVPALAADVTNADDLKTTSIVAVSPDATETTTYTSVIQTTPVIVASNGSAPVALTSDGQQLPQTASELPLVVLFGFLSIALALGLMVLGKRATTSVI